MDEKISKSEQKRQADALQKVGVALIELSLAKLNTLPLTEPLLKAIIDAKSIKSHGAKRRQAQLIGKLMRRADFEEILAAYDKLLEADSATTAQFHELESWREQLIQGDKQVLTEFINVFQPQDVQLLRQLIKKAQEDVLHNKNTGASKALFRYLRSCIQ